MLKLNCRVLCCVTVMLLLATAAFGCGYGECPGSAPLTIEQLVPSDQEINCEASETFKVGSNEVKFTKVEYGQERDCASGCFSATVCAIEDGGEAKLFTGSWYDAAEAPNTLEEECPDLDENKMSTGSECEPSARSHPLTRTQKFEDFAMDEKGSGPFRLCVNRFDEGDFGP